MCQAPHLHLQDKEQCLLVGLNGALSLLSCSPSFPLWECKSLSFSFSTQVLPRIPGTNPAVCAWLQPTPSLQSCCICRELQRPGAARACEGTRAGSWHCPLLCPQMPAPAVTPRAPGRDEGRATAAAIPEDAKGNKHLCDPQKQAKHGALVRTTSSRHVPALPEVTVEAFSLALGAGEQEKLFECPPASTHARAEPCAGCTGWTIPLQCGLGPLYPMGYGSFFPENSSVPVDEGSTGEELGDERSQGTSLPSNKAPTGMCM